MHQLATDKSAGLKPVRVDLRHSGEAPNFDANLNSPRVPQGLVEDVRLRCLGKEFAWGHRLLESGARRSTTRPQPLAVAIEAARSTPLPTTSSTWWLPVASTTTLMTRGSIQARIAARGCETRNANHTAYAHQADHPTCRLGMAEKWLAPLPTSRERWPARTSCSASQWLVASSTSRCDQRSTDWSACALVVADATAVPAAACRWVNAQAVVESRVLRGGVEDRQVGSPIAERVSHPVVVHLIRKRLGASTGAYVWADPNQPHQRFK